MKRSQLLKDIDRHASERFQRWLLDTADTYKMAGLGFAEFHAQVVYLTLSATASSCVQMETDRQLIHEALDEILDEVAKKYEAVRKEKQS